LISSYFDSLADGCAEGIKLMGSAFFYWNVKLLDDPLKTVGAATMFVLSGFLIPCSFYKNFWNNFEPFILSKLLVDVEITFEVLIGLTTAACTPS
jgi:hypothetical protein